MGKELFTEESIRHALMTVQTQHGIIPYARAMAEVLAAAAIASNKAIGDSPSYAARKWSEVILTEALRIIKEKQAENPTPMQKKLRAEFGSEK